MARRVTVPVCFYLQWPTLSNDKGEAMHGQYMPVKEERFVLRLSQEVTRSVTSDSVPVANA